MYALPWSDSLKGSGFAQSRTGGLNIEEKSPYDDGRRPPMKRRDFLMTGAALPAAGLAGPGKPLEGASASKGPSPDPAAAGALPTIRLGDAGGLAAHPRLQPVLGIFPQFGPAR